MSEVRAHCGENSQSATSDVDDYAVWAEFGEVLNPVDAVKDLPPVDQASGRMLDVGAGTGRFALAFLEANPGWSVVAVEPSRSMRTALMTHLTHARHLMPRLTVIPETLQRAQVGEFDVVVLRNMMYVDAAADLVENAAQRLQPGGRLLIQRLPAGSSKNRHRGK